MILLVFIIIIIPIFLILEYNLFFIIYIKGASTKDSLIFEILMDYINTVSFFLRINIQLIRILIVTIFFYLYVEIYDAYNLEGYGDYYSDLKLENFNEYALYYSSKLISFFLNLLYEIGHF